MSNSAIERCPRCGSPYMSAMLPNETPATRYCYTCATAAGSLKERLDMPAVESDPNDLELQPLDEPSSASGRRTRPAAGQIAPRARGPLATRGGSSSQIRPAKASGLQPKVISGLQPKVGSGLQARVEGASKAGIPAAASGLTPVAVPGSAANIKPVSASNIAPASAVNITPVNAQRTGSQTSIMPAVGQSISSRRSYHQQARSSAAIQAAAAKPEASPTKWIVALCGAALLAIGAFFVFKGGKSTPPPETTVTSVSKPVDPPKPAVITPTAPTPAPVKKSSSTPSATSAKPDDSGAHIGFASPADPNKAPEPVETPAPVAPKPDPKTSAAELNNLLSKSANKKSVGASEGEEIALAPADPAKPPATPIVPRNPTPPAVVTPDDPSPVSPTKPAAPAMPPIPKNAINLPLPTNPADPATPAVADGDDMDNDGKPKKPKRSLIENIAGIDDKPVKHEVDTEKKENPFAIKVIPVTALEPTILPADLEKIAGNDRFLSDQTNALARGWHVRDANYAISKIDIPHQGREHVITLNPLNDVLPAKLIATIEIPKTFAKSQPMLRFEVSSAVNGKDWLLSVKANGVDLIPKTKIKQPKSDAWLDVPIDLSALADKHFDLQIEVGATTKHPKGAATEIGYIRNVRFEWKKK